MNFRDALLADHGADRMPVDMDRRLRRRLGLEAAVARRVWLRPAIAGLAVAAVALAVIFYPAAKQRPHAVVATTIDAAPGTQVVKTSASTVLLTHGSIKMQRKDATPMVVDVPIGRVVIAASSSMVTADRESVTIWINDGSGHYDDANGQSHPLIPNKLLVWPPPPPSASPTAPTMPAPVPPTRKHAGAATVAPPSEQTIQEAPPGETPPSMPPARPPHADMPCTFKSDCDDGQTCRKNERGESVCMGKGGEGAACWFDNDCVSQACEQRRCVGP